MLNFLKRIFVKEIISQTDYSLLNIHDLTGQYLAANANKRKFIRNSFNDDASWNLILQSRVLAVEAVRQQDYDLVKKGIILHSIENARYDLRDNIIRLSLLYNSGKKLKEDPDILFREIAKISDSKIKNVLLSFPKRTPENKSITAMGYKEIYDPQFDYVHK